MKKVIIRLTGFLLVCTLLLSVTGTAKAGVYVPEGLPDPVVTPVSGDTDFTTEVVPIASLPGTHELASQMLAPVGFPDGEAQFGGNGIRVTKMDSGKATACFSLSTIAVQQGWGGKVAVWNGTKWVRLATSFSSSDESATTLACATISGNGTYAFIKWVVDSSLLPVAKSAVILPTCSSVHMAPTSRSMMANGSYSPYFVQFVLLDVTYPSLPNVEISYSIIDSNVPLVGALSGSAMSNGSGTAAWNGTLWRYEGSPITSLTFTIHFETPVCYDDFFMDWTFGLPTVPEPD